VPKELYQKLFLPVKQEFWYYGYMKIVFSGAQASGEMTIGNYLGAFRHFAPLQDEADQTLYCVVDLHAITVPQDPKILRKNIYNAVASLLASGVDPKKSIVFVQSEVSEHAELTWILNSIATVGEVSRMTQYKEKAEGKDSVSVGLFDYPVLMAADILLYDTTSVPVGEDQKQHLELTRDLAIRFNNRFGKTFVVPEPEIAKEGARIMSLQDPGKKMSKSDPSELSYVLLTDSDEAIRDKFKRAVTDSGTETKAGKDKPTLTNLLTIYSLCADKSVAEIEKEYAGKGYAEFKAGLAEVVVQKLKPIREKIQGYSETELDKILADGAERAREIASKKLVEVKKKVGLGRA
jgi:tryptophanyl-tRNA synthetase